MKCLPKIPNMSPITIKAMVHQLLGINNNRVSLAGVPGVTKDLQVNNLLIHLPCPLFSFFYQFRLLEYYLKLQVFED